MPVLTRMDFIDLDGEALLEGTDGVLSEESKVFSSATGGFTQGMSAKFCKSVIKLIRSTVSRIAII